VVSTVNSRVSTHEPDFSQLGINLTVLQPGEPMGMYHWEADQEDFLVMSGEALLFVEGEERALRQWDLVHCLPGTEHTIVGAGQTACVVVAVGARNRSTGAEQAYARFSVEAVARDLDAALIRAVASSSSR